MNENRMDDFSVQQTKSRDSRNKKLWRFGAVGLTVILVCGLIMGTVFAAGTGSDAGSLVYTASTAEPMSAAEVYAKTVNSTVGVTVSGTTNLFGYETMTAASGSGFIVTEDGYILTNYHVVEGAQNITVTTYDDESFDAELIGYDDSNDIAVLKIEAVGLQPVTIGDSDKVVVGEEVAAIGNPLGELTFSLTTGIISALDREVTFSGGTRMRLIQTDCAINSGNSGGALFNMYGEVIGITNGKYSSSANEVSVDNIAFAIPINSVANIVEQIMTNGEISSPYIGVTVSDVGADLTAYGIPEGANVYTVVEDSPADEAGLQENDIITAVNGEPITGKNDLVDIVKKCVAGDELELTVYRQGDTLKLTVTVGENVKPALPQQEETESGSEQQPQQEQQIITIPGDIGLGDLFGQFFN